MTTLPPTTPAPTTPGPMYSLIDLTEGWEVPVGNVAITALRVRAVAYDRQDRAWLHFDMGQGNEIAPAGGALIGTRFEFIRTTSASFMTTGLVAFSTVRCGCLDGFVNNPALAEMIGVRLISDGASVYTMRVVETDGVSFNSQDGAALIASGTRYFCEFVVAPADGILGSATLTIRTGSHVGPVVETIVLGRSSAPGAGYRFFMPWFGSGDFGAGVRTTSFDIDNVEIDGFSVQNSTTLIPTPFWPPEIYNASKFTPVDGGDVVFTLGVPTLEAENQDKQDDDYVFQDLQTPVAADFTAVVRISSFTPPAGGFWTFGGFLALGTVPGSANVVGDANEGYLGFGIEAPGSTPRVSIVEGDGVGNTTQETGGLDVDLQSDVNFLVCSLDYDGGVGLNGAATCAFRIGHPENVRTADEVTKELAAQHSYDSLMTYSGWGNVGEGSRMADTQLSHTWTSFDSSAPLTTLPPTTPAPTTPVPPTPPPTTLPPTAPPTTIPPTQPPVTPPPPGVLLRPQVSAIYKAVTDTLLVRAWVEDSFRTTLAVVITYDRCTLEVRDEEGTLVGLGQGVADPAGAEYVRFELQNLQVASEHNYTLVVKIAMPGAGEVASGAFPMPTEG